MKLDMHSMTPHMTRTPTKRHESNGPPPGDIGVWGGLIMHHDKCRRKTMQRKKKLPEKKFAEFFFLEKKIFRIFFQQLSESSDSRCKMSSNRRHNGVRLVNKLSWIRSDGPKVPKMRRNEKTIFY